MLLRLSTSVLLIAALTGCAQLSNRGIDRYGDDDLQAFAFELGSTHASFRLCPAAPATQLDAHLQTARLALRANAGRRLPELNTAFERGLRDGGGAFSGRQVDCSCVVDLLEDSRQHNLALFRQATLPRVQAKAVRSP
jgi:hypothetical protein